MPRGVLPPNVRPAEEYTGFAGPANLTADSMAEVSSGTFAPRMVLITEPERKIRNVGMLLLLSAVRWDEGRAAYAVTPYCCAIACWLSTLTFVNVTRPGFEYFVERDSYVGATALQGPHQSA